MLRYCQREGDVKKNRVSKKSSTQRNIYGGKYGNFNKVKLPPRFSKLRHKYAALGAQSFLGGYIQRGAQDGCQRVKTQ